MGRGLSPLQRDLLGLAYAVNRYTLDGKPTVKAGPPLDGYTCPTVDYRGSADLNTALGIYAVKRIAPSTEAPTGIFRGTPKCKSAKAAVSRAIARLMERGLLVCQPKRGELYCYGYVLTAAGFEIAKDIECDPPGLIDAVELFGIQAGTAYRASQIMHNGLGLGFPLHYAAWCYEKSLYADRNVERNELIRRLQDALTVIEGAAPTLC
jgi:hypothetical protein